MHLADNEPIARWSFRLFKGSSYVYHVPHAPCWAHRILQRVLLGVIWERL
jgi:hypothetical protein